MADFTIYIGNKNYSSWSLRGLADGEGVRGRLRRGADPALPAAKPGRAAAPFALGQGAGAAATARWWCGSRWRSANIWPSACPRRSCGPADPAARARRPRGQHRDACRLRRSAAPSADEHALESSPAAGSSPEVQADLDRIAAIWRDCRTPLRRGRGRFSSAHFTIADAMYAPVVSRLRTYRVDARRRGAGLCRRRCGPIRRCRNGRRPPQRADGDRAVRILMLGHTARDMSEGHGDASDTHAQRRRDPRRDAKPGYDKVLTTEALAFVAELERRFGAERKRLLAARAERQAEARCRREARLPGGDARHPRGDWTVAPLPKDLLDRRVEITGPDRPQDGDQRAQFRRQRLHGRFRGCQHADLGQSHRGPDQPHRRGAAHASASTIPQNGRALHAQRQDRDAAGAAARLASAGGACAGRRRADVGLAVRFRALFLPQRQGAAAARHRPLFLSAEDGEPARGAAVERRLRRKPEAARRRPTARSRRRC